MKVIELKNVSFKYDEEYVVKNVSFSIEKDHIQRLLAIMVVVKVLLRN